MVIKITKAKAISAVRQAVKTQGREYVADCVYQSKGQPGCIVGHALFNLGVSIDVLDAMDQHAAPITWPPILDILADRGVTVTPKALDFLETAQTVQDTTATWGKALDTALAGEPR